MIKRPFVIGIYSRLALRLVNNLTCYSALIALHEPWISSNINSSSGCLADSDCSRYAKTVTEAISKMIAAKSLQHLPEIACNTEMISL